MKIAFKIVTYIFAFIGFILVAVYAAEELGLTKTPGIIDGQHDFFKDQVKNALNSTSSAAQASATNYADPNNFAWRNTPEWRTLEIAIIKDTDSINRAAEDSGVPARLIVAPLVVEQLRLFHDNREIFKSIFAPLKILGNQSQFSWGVMGIKQDTAIEIEQNLNNSLSAFYPGPAYEHMLDYPATTSSADIGAARFARLTNENNRYYSYLYAGLYIRELETQWKNAGFPIDRQPAIVATLYNIGFGNSHPNALPHAGGAEIYIGTSTYSFGGLAESFYYSDALAAEFPAP
ncbi:MAG: hypothetical protein KGI59_00900 [Patescibacteria group bacterium]|nr:hypothetical protein [Patescibacteria group bacterium]